MKIHKFNNSLEKSKRGTQIILEYLQKRPHIKEVVDVQDDVLYQEDDIDLLALLNDGSKKTIEIKVDSYYYKSKNIFWEEKSCVETNASGCFMYSKADLFFYYFYPGDVLYIFPIKKVRKWYLQNQLRFQQKTIKNWRYDKTTYTSLGRIIPRDIFITENDVIVRNQIENIF